MPDPKQLIQAEHWLEIPDFSAGAYNHTEISLDQANMLLPAGKGAHDPSGTYSCIALPGGGLGPLPGVVQTFTWPGTNETINYLVGFVAHDNLNNGDTEFVVIWEADDGTNHMWDAYSYIVQSGAFASIVSTFTASAAGIFGSPYPQFSRAVASTDPATDPGIPIIVFPNGGPAQTTTDGQVYMYPDPDAPSTMGARELISGSSSVGGQVIAHQSRILVLSGINYDHPVGGGWLTNEQISFTDPPNTETLGFQQTVLGAEDPFGYGAAGSISAGELFLLKKRGGGLIVSGDIFSLTVTALPGVTSTGDFYGNAASGVIGLVYCSLSNGCWIWNGSNTSQKLSDNLDDDFFLPVEFYGGMQSNNYGFFADWNGDKLYLSNNWLYDSRSNSWWKYYPDSTQGGDDLYYHQTVGEQYLYAAPLSFPSSSPIFAYQFDQKFPAQNYQWTSLPLHLAGEDRVTDVREVVVRASCADTGVSAVTVSILDGGTVVASQAQSGTVGHGPDIIRFTLGALGLREPQVRINVDNSASGDSAIIHSISVGYKNRAHVPSTNAG